MNSTNFIFELTKILVPDKKYGGYSAFFAQFPEAIAQGETEEETTRNLYELFKLMLQDKKENRVAIEQMNEVEYISEPVVFAAA